MSRYHHRRQQFLQGPETAAGYWEMDTELQLIQALDAIREQRQLNTEELAQRMGRHREAVSRLLHAEHPNPTLDTLSDLLKALNVTAEIRLRPSEENEPAITVSVSDVA